MKRGVVYWVNLEPASPPEFGKVRPGLIISNSELNLSLETVVILPLSSQAPEIWPFRLALKVPGGRESYVVIPGIRQVHKARLQEPLGSISAIALARVEEALEAYLRD